MLKSVSPGKISAIVLVSGAFVGSDGDSEGDWLGLALGASDGDSLGLAEGTSLSEVGVGIGTDPAVGSSTLPGVGSFPGVGSEAGVGVGGEAVGDLVGLASDGAAIVGRSGVGGDFVGVGGTSVSGTGVGGVSVDVGTGVDGASVTEIGVGGNSVGGASVGGTGVEGQASGHEGRIQSHTFSVQSQTTAGAVLPQQVIVPKSQLRPSVYSSQDSNPNKSGVTSGQVSMGEGVDPGVGAAVGDGGGNSTASMT